MIDAHGFGAHSLAMPITPAGQVQILGYKKKSKKERLTGGKTVLSSGTYERQKNRK
jgi:hypothetical protein